VTQRTLTTDDKKRVEMSQLVAKLSAANNIQNNVVDVEYKV